MYRGGEVRPRPPLPGSGPSVPGSNRGSATVTPTSVSLGRRGLGCLDSCPLPGQKDQEGHSYPGWFPSTLVVGRNAHISGCPGAQRGQSAPTFWWGITGSGDWTGGAAVETVMGRLDLGEPEMGCSEESGPGWAPTG